MRLTPWLWTAAIAGMAFWMSSPWGPRVHLPDPVHVVMHLGLFGVLAAMIARFTRLDAALGLTLIGGAAVELAQMLASGRWLDEALYDMGVDALGAVAGLLVARAPGVDERVGYWLHPVVLAPLAMFGTMWASGVGGLRALVWTGVAMAWVAPAVLAWGFGVRAGWYPHLDEIDATQRREIFAVGTLCAVGNAATAVWTGPAAAAHLGIALGFGMGVVSLVTRQGFKISGHVAVPLLLAVAAWPWTARGAGCLVLAGLLLSRARVGAGRHTPIEVFASWGLAAVGAALALAS